MQSEEYLILAALVFFAVSVWLVWLAFVRSHTARVVARRIRKQAEADHAVHGGWFIHRDGDVYRAATDAEFLQLCRDGRITPYDEVYGGTDAKWRRAVAVPLADLMFPARLTILAGPPARMSGWLLFVLLAWSMSVLNELRGILDRSIGSSAADVVAAGLLILGLMWVWHHIRQSAPAAQPANQNV